MVLVIRVCSSFHLAFLFCWYALLLFLVLLVDPIDRGIQISTIQYYTIQYNTIQYNTIQSTDTELTQPNTNEREGDTDRQSECVWRERERERERPSERARGTDGVPIGLTERNKIIYDKICV